MKVLLKLVLYVLKINLFLFEYRTMITKKYQFLIQKI